MSPLVLPFPIVCCSRGWEPILYFHIRFLKLLSPSSCDLYTNVVKPLQGILMHSAKFQKQEMVTRNGNNMVAIWVTIWYHSTAVTLSLLLVQTEAIPNFKSPRLQENWEPPAPILATGNDQKTISETNGTHYVPMIKVVSSISPSSQEIEVCMVAY